MPKNLHYKISCLFYIFCIPISVYADAGLPIIVVTYPVILFLLIPIIFIEGYVIYKAFKLSIGKSLIISSVLNGFTTIIGFPLSWIFLFLFQFLLAGTSCGLGFDNQIIGIFTTLLQSAWLCPNDANVLGIIFLASGLLISIAFFISVYFERILLKTFLKQSFYDEPLLMKTVYKMNILTYSLVLCFDFIYILFNF